MSKLLEDIKEQHERGMELSDSAIDWLIERVEKLENKIEILQQQNDSLRSDCEYWMNVSTEYND